ncbi:uncharacterized protein LOC108118169 [Drosophila eugracilis]|uniref:uncharacterized protein LOC108118169 n=1 Tax=Drosophila eugracilis TaxID=29029 RepID=UPI0007E6E311|nr:uncharacterized protein LOC108118169 [Drosophila eugracilis]
MHFTTLLSLFVVLCLTLVAGQERDCDELARRCESCVRRLNNSIDRELPLLNKECRERTQRRWRWRDIGRCELTKLNCLGWERRMTCADIAELAGMERRRD